MNEDDFHLQRVDDFNNNVKENTICSPVSDTLESVVPQKEVKYTEISLKRRGKLSYIVFIIVTILAICSVLDISKHNGHRKIPLKWCLFNRKMAFNGQRCLLIDFSDVHF